MLQALRRHWPWILAWCVLTLLGGLALARHEMNRLREDFETDARIAHRLLSQRVVQQDAVMATLSLLQPAEDGSHPEQRLASVYPQILGVQSRQRHANWPNAQLLAAETLSRALRRPALAGVDFARGRYQLVLASEPASYALDIDLRSAVPWSEWPMAADSSPVRVTLEHEGQTFVIQPGRLREGGWQFEFHKHLAAASQPFDMVAVRQVGMADLPWGWMLLWGLAVAGALAALLALQRQRAERRRAEELLRLGQVARLNTLGELAAGMAHELNQPLTAVLANTQAASRLLADDPPDLSTARHAMAQAAQQARRASDVVTRLRRAVERPDLSAQQQALSLQDAVDNALYLLEPELKRREVATLVTPSAMPPMVQAEPVALEQIIHNLLMNALQALEQVPAAERQLTIRLVTERQHGVLVITDSGAGIAADVLPRIFEPFFSTRDGGLGLGLSLCETLAASMGGSLSAAPHSPRGMAFSLSLPLAKNTA
ncbi:His Kinase A (phospho-acceptor) domain-containing protein [Polaromonas sp. OV174]|uniref:sensor histidine kinase n=1 Tax=Polaromonas sp. OV174 TaxID=1855300 RepID=UPI0008EBED92|nr:ATP-binding protein [Polaromonas sp. OV174]SFB91241.1 His Kinase A (phospho-acceptor) domain-containing protein [Polaromonas sp. OV174]